MKIGSYDDFDLISISVCDRLPRSLYKITRYREHTHNVLSVLHAVSASCWAKLFLRVFQSGWSFSSMELLDMMEPMYERFSAIMSASSLRMINYGLCEVDLEAKSCAGIKETVYDALHMFLRMEAEGDVI